MVSKAVLEVLQVWTTLTGSVFRMTALRFRGLTEVRVVYNSPAQQQTELVWKLLMYLSVSVTALEAFSRIHSWQNQLPTILSNCVLVIMKLGPMGFLLLFQWKVDDIRLILNYILTSSHKSKVAGRAKMTVTEKHLLPALLSLSIAFPFLYLLGLPTMSIVLCGNLRRFHSKMVGTQISGSASWNALILVIDMICMIPPGCMSVLGMCTALVVLTTTQVEIRCMMNGKSDDALEIGIRYRELQIFTLICNGAFKNFIWGVTQFFGGVGLIPICYGLIVLHAKLSSLMITGILLLTVASVLYFILFFHIGSQPVKLSGKFLRMTKDASWVCPYSRRFFWSCPVIAMQIGDFHKLDRKRSPDFFRFVLQRTAFFAANTGDEND